ncbi:MAG: hypothetical protein V3W19_02135 [Desulfatiglandales bacterium]
MQPIQWAGMSDLKTGKRMGTTRKLRKAKRGEYKFEVVYHDDGGRVEFAIYRKVFRGKWIYNVVSRDRDLADKKNK